MERSSYDDLIFGMFSPSDVKEAVNDTEWQLFRLSLKGLPTDMKLAELRRYAEDRQGDERMYVQVTNYIYALKRGGLLR
jgi:hypothetical protein